MNAQEWCDIFALHVIYAEFDSQHYFSFLQSFKVRTENINYIILNVKEIFFSRNFVKYVILNKYDVLGITDYTEINEKRKILHLDSLKMKNTS